MAIILIITLDTDNGEGRRTRRGVPAACVGGFAYADYRR